MGFLIVLLTVTMVLDCLLLIFLVLLQLPKKDAGAGVAFGASATDALFGAGSGNVLTKITKYSAITFFGLAIVLSVMENSYHKAKTTAFERKLAQPGKLTLPSVPSSSTPPAVKGPVVASPTTSTTS